MGTIVWKTAAIILSVFQTTQAWQIWICKGTIDNCLKFPYENAAQICTSGYFDTALKTIISVHPYKSSPRHEHQEKLANTLLAKEDRNVLLVDWSDEANSILIGVDYIVFAQKVSNEMTSALTYMPCFAPEKTTILGTSLGGQMAGTIGRQYCERTGNPIDQAIGLDPAKPLYDDPLIIFNGIGKDSASFVLVIHSDNYKYGVSSPCGHIDMWPNADTHDRDGHQPGCTQPAPPPFYTFTDKDLCDHKQAVIWFTDALIYPGLLLGIYAFDAQSWVEGKGDSNRITDMGDADTELSGNFYMCTNLQSPYGKGIAGTYPNVQ